MAVWCHHNKKVIVWLLVIKLLLVINLLPLKLDQGCYISIAKYDIWYWISVYYPNCTVQGYSLNGTMLLVVPQVSGSNDMDDCSLVTLTFNINKILTNLLQVFSIQMCFNLCVMVCHRNRRVKCYTPWWPFVALLCWNYMPPIYLLASSHSVVTMAFVWSEGVHSDA